MSIKKLLDLQLFAEGGDAGGAAGGEGAAVVSPADDGQAALEALGVPKDRITERAKTAVAKKRQMAKAQTGRQTEGQAAADAKDNETQTAAPAAVETKEAVPQRLSWEEVKKDPEYNREIQNLIRARLKGQETLRPALEMLAGKYKLEMAEGKLDEEALAKAIMEDDSLWEEKAGELGVDASVARRLDKLERMEARQAAEQQRTVQEEAMRQHWAGLVAQEQEMKQLFPGFNLEQELRNPTFARMTSPNGGISVKAAYYAVHHEEIQQASTRAAAQRAAEQVAASVQANRNRPVEHGTSGQAPTMTGVDYSKMTRSERNAMNERIRRGEKIYPGKG